MATLPAQTRRFKLRISAILCKNSSDLFLDTKGHDWSGSLKTAGQRSRRVTFLPGYLIALHFPCDGSRAQRVRNPAPAKDYLHTRWATVGQCWRVALESANDHRFH
jgi:hypothetical protein